MGGLLTITLKIKISGPAFSLMASITTKTNTKQVLSKYETSFCDKYEKRLKKYKLQLSWRSSAVD